MNYLAAAKRAQKKEQDTIDQKRQKAIQQQNKIAEYLNKCLCQYGQWYNIPAKGVWGDLCDPAKENEIVQAQFLGFNSQYGMVWSDGYDHMHGMVMSSPPFYPFDNITPINQTQKQNSNQNNNFWNCGKNIEFINVNI